MNIQPLQLARVPDLLTSTLSTSQINTTQQQLLQVENQLSTGKLFSQPSDNPTAASMTMGLQRTLDQQKVYLSNLSSNQTHLGEVDSTLSDLTALIQQAQNIASADVSSTVPQSQRTSDAAVVDSIFSQAMNIANKQFNGSYLFGGAKGATPPFVAAANGVEFVGSTQLLANSVDTSSSMAFMVGGPSVFGATSSQVQGTVDLTPNLSLNTRLTDLGGATGGGVHLGTIQISNGTTTKLVNLSNADTVGDVVNAINNAAVGGIAASISGKGLTLTAGAGDNISVTDLSGSTTAADLGISQSAAAGVGVALVGSSTQPRVTVLTPLADLNGGSGIDPTGIQISNGVQTTNISFAGATNVGDLLNVINGSSAKVQAQINSGGTGIDVVNPIQGATMTIAENGGGSAADLGIRSFSPQTQLSDLNGGKGIALADSGPDFNITLSDGTTFGVSLNGAQTVQDVIDDMNTAAGGAGFTAGFSATTNGITLTDTSGGAGDFTIASANGSTAANDLGLGSAAVGGIISGNDVNPISAPGIFSNLTNLRNALQSGDVAGITSSAQGLQGDYTRVVQVRADAGASVQEIQNRQSQLQDEQVATQSLMSQLSDTDFTAAITRFQTLQTSLQATLETTAKTLGLNLLNFLA